MQYWKLNFAKYFGYLLMDYTFATSLKYAIQWRQDNKNENTVGKLRAFLPKICTISANFNASLAAKMKRFC